MRQAVAAQELVLPKLLLLPVALCSCAPVVASTQGGTTWAEQFVL